MVNNIQEELKKIEDYAKETKVPIMLPDGISYLTQFIKEHKITRILEIGTAIGYSAIQMALIDPSIQVVSVERDEGRYQEALKNVKQFGLEDQITLLLQDALEVEIKDSFDLIFIDAAKGQNIRFFERFEKNLVSGGYIVTDNLDFHGMVQVPLDAIESRNVRGLVRKIKEYKNYLEKRNDYETIFYSVGDGISVSRKI